MATRRRKGKKRTAGHRRVKHKVRHKVRHTKLLGDLSRGMAKLDQARDTTYDASDPRRRRRRVRDASGTTSASSMDPRRRKRAKRKSSRDTASTMDARDRGWFDHHPEHVRAGKKGARRRKAKTAVKRGRKSSARGRRA